MRKYEGKGNDLWEEKQTRPPLRRQMKHIPNERTKKKKEKKLDKYER